MNKKIPRHSLYLPPNILKTFFKLALKRELIKGNFISDFTQEFKRYIGIPHALFVSSARAGLYLLFSAFQFKKDDEIIMAALNYGGIPYLLKSYGLVPKFVDVNPRSYSIDPEKIEKEITPKTRAIIITHLFGSPADIDTVLKIAKKNNLKVIEDCAHACGAECKGKKVGSFGDAAVFSFGLGKCITTFKGGMITCKEEQTLQELHKIIQNSRPISTSQLLLNISTGLIQALATNLKIFSFFVYPLFKIINVFNPDFIDSFLSDTETSLAKNQFKPEDIRNPSNFQAAIGIYALQKLDFLNKKRRENIMHMLKYLKNTAFTSRLQSIAENSTGLYYMLKCLSFTERQQLRRRLFCLGVDTQICDFFNCAQLKNFSDGKKYPTAEMLFSTLLQIPNGVSLAKNDMEKIAFQLKNIWGKLSQDDEQKTA